MYKVIIADDERNIRESLKKFILTQKMGIDVVATFDDGDKVIEFIDQNDVDLIITDVVMGLISGLEVAKYVYEHKPYIKVVIISGFQNFEFAKEALKYNVKNYISKPAKLEDIKTMLAVLKEQIDESRSMMSKEKRLSELASLEQSQVFEDAVYGLYDNSDMLREQLSTLYPNTSYDNRNCTIISIGYSEKGSEVWKHGKERFCIALINYCEVKEEYEIHQVYRAKEQIKLLLIAKAGQDEQLFQTSVEDFIVQLQNELKDLFGVQSSISFGKMYADIFDIAGKSELLLNGHTEISDFFEVCKIAITHFENKHFEQMVSLISLYMSHYEHSGLEKVKFQMLSMLILIKEKLQHISGSPALFELNEEKILYCKQFLEIEHFARDYIYLLCQYFHDITSDDVVDKAKLYIETNIEKDLSIDDVAEFVFLNSNYFGRLFKEQTGETFTDYMIKIRMNRAIEMLMDKKYKIYEIGEYLGYSASRSFVRTFKKYTGYTPRDYANKLTQEE